LQLLLHIFSKFLKKLKIEICCANQQTYRQTVIIKYKANVAAMNRYKIKSKENIGQETASYGVTKP
jgi:hypothetical protein